MKDAPSLVARFVRATVAVAVASALLLAGAAALIAWALWEAGGRRDLEARAGAVVERIEADMEEGDWRLEEDVPEALWESGLVGYRLEAWDGNVLIAANQPGPTLGPRPFGSSSTAGWLITTQRLPRGLALLVGAPRSDGIRALRVSAWSLLLAAPLCLGLAFLAGRAVAVRAARPLLDLRDRVQAAGPQSPFVPPPTAAPVAEVREIQEAFGALWQRLEDALSRERDFAANASHELRTPLTRVRLHGERATALAGGAAAAELEAQRAEIDRMARLVDSLLVLARDVSAGSAGETVNIADVVRECARDVFDAGPAAEVAAPDEVFVRGDEHLLRIAVVNLLDNARKFKEPGVPARVTVEPSPDWVRVGVTSPGARIAAEEKNRLFERFYRGADARAAHDGHGLGLALTRHIARLHAGDVECTSDPGQDAQFVLRVPSWTVGGAVPPSAPPT
ncbi:MAG TPA: HAMP domain-containing sensor histidine kinase [Vicinamibacteria bacterium]|nr:HAMP domain-containing sensor histidine kinase [Vicinamibacteria bacterium]